MLVQSHKSILSFGALFCAPEFYQHLNDQTNLYASHTCSATPLHNIFIISDLGSHDSGKNYELLRPNIHHTDNQGTKTQKVLDWEPLLRTPTVSKSMPCNQLLASLAFLHFNDSSLHQAVKCELHKTKPALVIQTHKKHSSSFSFYKLYTNISFNKKRDQLHLSYLL